MGNKIFRRNFIKSIGLAFSSAYIAGCATAKTFFDSPGRKSASAADDTLDCIIIGAGASGLTLARELVTPTDKNQTSKKVLVLEASNRLGGRIQTDRSEFSRQVERGAEFVHMDALKVPLWRELLKYKLKTWKLSKTDGYIFHPAEKNSVKEGKITSVTLSALKWNPFKALTIWSSLKVKINKPDMSARKFLDTIVAASKDRYEFDFKTMILTGHLGALPEDLSMRGFQSDQIPDQLSYLGEFYIQNGYDSLIKNLAQNINVEFNQEVREITYAKNSVTVETVSGTIYKAKSVALTVPLGVIKSGAILFNPALPQEKKNAIDSLEMSFHAKVHIEFEKRFWPKKMSMLHRPDTQRRVGKTYFVSQTNSPGAKPMLTALIMGPDAKKILDMPDAEIFKNVCLDIQDCFPEAGDIDKLVSKKSNGQPSYLVTHWNRDRLFKGGISFIKYGFENKIAPENVRGAFAKSENTPGLFWAGEAAATFAQPACVHGAHSAGARAAIEIHHYLTNNGTSIDRETLAKTYKKLWTDYIIGNKIGYQPPGSHFGNTTPEAEEMTLYKPLIEDPILK